MFQEEAEEDDRVQRPTARNNLFEELFPEEQRLPASPPPRLKKVTIKPFEWNKGLVTPALYHRGDPFNSQEGLAMYPPVEREIPIADSTPGMHVVEEEMHRDGLQPVVVVLKGASPHLEESDFFRITPKGAHIEGWTSGIIKVVQSREATTLSSLSTYYILFTSEVAALAYMDQTRRLHNLARSNLGGIMIPSTAITASSIEYEATAAIRSFSLIPGQQKLEMQKLRHPYPEAAKHMIYNHGPKHLRDLRPNQEGLVVFGLQSGIATVRDIKEVLDKDGRTRNFLWDLVPENPIVELTSLRNGQTVRPPRRMVNGGWDNLKSKENHENYVVPSRFVLKFQKTDEARRFVREWHRRPFPQPSLYGDDEDAPVVEASYLW
ncbi:hypothetical protein BJ878DRAFT_420544 [Calycina marina]|uniref:Uncharacterized protein n=1 Tax=Calycina marina TaxID=1763456 RepID=A0A9P7Z3W6_9HELO|nr:hypothetical protein BJ878DRAFT_420544 [Calycina marina]